MGQAAGYRACVGSLMRKLALLRTRDRLTVGLTVASDSASFLSTSRSTDTHQPPFKPLYSVFHSLCVRLARTPQLFVVFSETLLSSLSLPRNERSSTTPLGRCHHIRAANRRDQMKMSCKFAVAPCANCSFQVHNGETNWMCLGSWDRNDGIGLTLRSSPDPYITLCSQASDVLQVNRLSVNPRSCNRRSAHSTHAQHTYTWTSILRLPSDLTRWRHGERCRV